MPVQCGYRVLESNGFEEMGLMHPKSVPVWLCFLKERKNQTLIICHSAPLVHDFRLGGQEHARRVWFQRYPAMTLSANSMPDMLATAVMVSAQTWWVTMGHRWTWRTCHESSEYRRTSGLGLSST